MKTLIATLAAAAAVTTLAAPAAAHQYDRGYGHQRYERGWDDRYDINQRQRELQRLIERGERRGDLTGREAWTLRQEFHELARLEARFRSHGLNPHERAILDRRLDRLEAAVIRNLRDGQRDYGYRHWR